MSENKMKYNLLNIGNLQVVHGISWFPILSLETEKADLKELIEFEKPGLIVRVDGSQAGSVPVYGLIDLEFVSQKGLVKKKKFYSLGGIFSQLCKDNVFNENSIFLLDLISQNKNGLDKDILMVVIENGLPVSGSEIFDSKQYIYTELKQKWFAKQISYNIYSVNIDFNELNKIIPSNFQVNQLDLNLVSNLNNKQLKNCLLTVPVIEGENKKKLLFLLGGVALMGLVFYEDIMNFVMPPPPPPPPVDYKKIYEDGIKNLLKKEKYIGKEGLEHLNQIIKQVPTTLGGWNISRIKCNKNVCSLEYSPKDNISTNYLNFSKYAKPYIDKKLFNNLNYELNGRLVKVDYGTPEQYKFDSKLDFKKLPSLDKFKANAFSKYQDLSKLKLMYRFSKNKNVAVSGVSLSNIKADFISKGDFTLSGNGWILKELPIHYNMAINDLTITFNMVTYTTNFNVKGVYYIKENKKADKK